MIEGITHQQKMGQNPTRIEKMNIQCENLNKAFDEKILENIIANTAATKEKENAKNS
jgi:hypothetical protein